MQVRRIEHASLEEVLEFCNKVREVGGAELLPALLPGIPRFAEYCLIAINLNFDCMVVILRKSDRKGEYHAPEAIRTEDGRYRWSMVLDNEAQARKIGEALDLAVTQHFQGGWQVELPQPIGECARAFDESVHNPTLYPEFAKLRRYA